MRKNVGRWSMSGAVHIGHLHASKGQNCQDAIALDAIETDDFIIITGVVSDGCGGVHDDMKKLGLDGRTEVGASLLSTKALQYILNYVDPTAAECTTNLKLQASLAIYLIGYILKSTERTIKPDDRNVEIQRFWLATVVGFLVIENKKTNKSNGYLFSCGDGIQQIGDWINDINQDGKPKYLAYSCLDYPSIYSVPPDMIPDGFEVSEFNPNDINQLMISTDGFTNHNRNMLDKWKRENLTQECPDNLFGLQWGKTGQCGLKKWMNVQSNRGYFDDDCAIITLEKMPP